MRTGLMLSNIGKKWQAVYKKGDDSSGFTKCREFIE